MTKKCSTGPSCIWKEVTSYKILTLKHNLHPYIFHSPMPAMWRDIFCDSDFVTKWVVPNGHQKSMQRKVCDIFISRIGTLQVFLNIEPSKKFLALESFQDFNQYAKNLVFCYQNCSDLLRGKMFQGLRKLGAEGREFAQHLRSLKYGSQQRDS